jgi:uncharacterized protein
MTLLSMEVTAFEGNNRIASGSLEKVMKAVRTRAGDGETAPILVFDDLTGAQIDWTLEEHKHGKMEQPTEEGSETRTAGRPKLGVVAREVTLLPRHWEWLGTQRGGASAALRRLVEQARRESVGEERIRVAREALYRFMTAMTGNAPGYEEALRALFAGDSERFTDLIAEWPIDVREHIQHMAAGIF